MLLHVAFPIADLRYFRSSNVVSAPPWDSPAVGLDFIRGFGVAVSRPLKGLAGFPSEELFFSSRGALKLATIDSFSVEIAEATSVNCRLQFRRLYRDGPLVHLDIGIVADISGIENAAQAIRETIVKLLNTDIKVAGQAIRLIDLGKEIARHYCERTTTHGKSPEYNFVISGRPTVVCEIRKGSVSEIGKSVFDIENGSLRALVHPTRNQRSQTHVWIVGNLAAKPILTFGERIRRMKLFLRGRGQSKIRKPGTLRRDARRTLRLACIRLECERFTVYELLRSLQKEDWQVERGEFSDRLQKYMMKTYDLLKSPPTYLRRLGATDQGYANLVEALLFASDKSSPIERHTILDRLSSIRPQILRKVSKLAEIFEGTSLVYDVESESLARALLDLEVHMVDRSVNIGDGAQVVKSNVNTGDNAEQSLEFAEGSLEAREKGIAELEALVAELKASIDANKANRVQAQLEAVKQEAKSTEPDRSWFDVSAKGLAEAASAVAGLTPKIIEVLGQLRTLVFGA